MMPHYFTQGFAGGMPMRLITLYLPEPYIKALDRLVNEKYYPNRAEAIRVAVRDLLSVEAWGRKANG
jgi:Arc/MetJ-type ribon-helix-helix transcriptional regulator